MVFPKWQLEAFKMFIYMTFPVGAFFYFNQPQYFEKFVIKTKQQMYPPDDPKMRDMIEEAQRKHNAKIDIEFQAALEEYERREREKLF